MQNRNWIFAQVVPSLTGMFTAAIFPLDLFAGHSPTLVGTAPHGGRADTVTGASSH
jgi:hypothetical protein